MNPASSPDYPLQSYARLLAMEWSWNTDAHLVRAASHRSEESRRDQLLTELTLTDAGPRDSNAAYPGSRGRDKEFDPLLRVPVIAGEAGWAGITSSTTGGTSGRWMSRSHLPNER